MATADTRRIYLYRVLQDHLRLNCVSTIQDLASQNVELCNGQLLTLYNEELEVDGVVQYSQEENLWFATIDWNEIRQQQDLVMQVNG